ncbi:TonB-dependent siderophore receptor [Tistrella mobilis]|uniref:TonB-dependent siderophore receptor n=1 Tax=Tistrella mobilis TaxID=171437 RepID=UPI0031F68A39
MGTDRISPTPFGRISFNGRIPFNRSLKGSVALLALLAGMPLAAKADDAVVLPQLQVEDDLQTANGPIDGYVPRRSATGSKTDAAITEIPQSVSVVGRRQLDDLPGNKVDEVLGYTAGVKAGQFGTDSDTDWLMIRGFDAGQTGVFMNGLGLYQYGFGGYSIDPFLLERIDVLKGASSALYGGANVGGLINLVSKRPTGERLRHVETGINNWGNAFLGFDIGDALDADRSYRVTGKVSGGHWETDEAEDFRGVIAPSYTWEGDRTRVTLLGMYQDQDQTHTGGFWPYVGSVVPAAFGRIPRDFYYSEEDEDSYRRKQAMLGWEVEHDLNDAVTLRQNARYSLTDVRESGPYPYLWANEANGDLRRLGFRHDTTAQSFTVDNQAEWRVATGAVEHKLLAGIDYRFYTIDHVQESGAATPINVIRPVYGAAQPATAPYLDQTLDMHQLGGYVQDQMHIDRNWILTLTGRYDRVWTESKDGLAAGTNNYDSSEGALSGRAGLGYAFENGLTPYVSIATVFNPQIGTTGDGKPFEPEKGVQYEAGVKYMPDGFDALFTVSVYELTKTNAQVADTRTDSGGNLLYPFGKLQRGEIRSRGIELEARTELGDGFSLLGQASVGDVEITRDTTQALVGKTPTLVPDVTASLWLDHAFQSAVLDGLSAGAGIRYLGESWADETNTLKVPDATVVDAAIRYRQAGWGVSVDVANLLDKAYVTGCGSTAQCGYGPGRTATLTLSLDW